MEALLSPVRTFEEVPEPFKNVYPTGSAYICDPPVTDTDVDYVVLISEEFADYGSRLADDGWEVSYDDPEYRTHENEELPFITARRDAVNLIIFREFEGWAAFVKATEVAKSLNLTEKKDRVALFNAVCWGRALQEVHDFA